MVTYVRLPIDVRSPAAARQVLQQALHSYAAGPQSITWEGTVGDAVLMVSELVTNAVRHAPGLLLLEITIQMDTLHVAVVDDAPGSPVLHHPDPDDADSTGLIIVNALADRWGHTPGSSRKTVWFDLVLPSARQDT